MRQTKNKSDIISRLCEFLIAGQADKGADFANEHYPFVEIDKLHTRQYSKFEMMSVYLRDGFIDRYSGEKLLFPGLIRLLTLELPEIFKYHTNWKMSETHMVYWDLFPTIDHIVPIARGGTNSEDNWITTNQLRNSAKSNFTLEELGWEILPQGKLEDWDGLCSVFLKWVADGKLVEKYGNTDDWKYISGWFEALVQEVGTDKVSPEMYTEKPKVKNDEIILNLSLPKNKIQTMEVNVRTLGAGDLYKSTAQSKSIYLVLSPYDAASKSIATAVINSPQSNPANVICRLRTEKQNNCTVLQILDYPLTVAQIIDSLPPAQQFKIRRLYRGTLL